MYGASVAGPKQSAAMTQHGIPNTCKLAHALNLRATLCGKMIKIIRGKAWLAEVTSQVPLAAGADAMVLLRPNKPGALRPLHPRKQELRC